MKIKRTCLIGFAATIAAAACAADTYDLRERYREGQVLTVTKSYRAALSARGEAPSTMTHETETRYTVSKVKGGELVQVRARILDSEDTMAAGGEKAEKEACEYIGKTVTIDFSDAQTTYTVGGKEVAAEDLAPWDADLPFALGAADALAKVKVGDEWADPSGGLKYRLVQIVTLQGRPCGRVEISPTGEDEKGAPTLTAGRGECVIDLATGIPQSIELKGTLEMTDEDEQGHKTKVSGPMTVHMTLTEEATE